MICSFPGKILPIPLCLTRIDFRHGSTSALRNLTKFKTVVQCGDERKNFSRRIMRTGAVRAEATLLRLPLDLSIA
jgi:hypothetical protein